MRLNKDDVREALERVRALEIRENKGELRSTLQADVEAFLSAGGRIVEVTTEDCKGIPCRF